MADHDDDARLDRWQIESAGLHMRVDATEAGKLVRLADVMRWLMAAKQLPRQEAVDALCAPLEKASPARVFYVARRDTRAAVLEGDAARLGFHSVQTWAARELEQETLDRMRREPWRFDFRRSGGGPPSTLPLAAREQIRADVEAGRAWPVAPCAAERDKRVCDPGVPAVVRRIREAWARQPGRSRDPLGDPHSHVFPLAVSVRDAGVLWGWGAPPQAVVLPPSLTAFKDVAAFRRANKRSEWEPEHWDIVCNEIKRRGGSGKNGVAKGVADALGVTVRALNDRLKRQSIPDDGPGAGVVRHLMDGSRGRGGSWR